METWSDWRRANVVGHGALLAEAKIGGGYGVVLVGQKRILSFLVEFKIEFYNSILEEAI